MPQDISWNFVKMTLHQDAAFKERQAELRSRFRNADTYIKKGRGVDRRFQLYDLVFDTTRDGREFVAGHLTRSPKVAHGLSLDETTRRSEEGAVDVPEIADYTEFIYDFRACVLAFHRRAPFTNPKTVATVWQNLLGLRIKEGVHAGAWDVHAEVMRDPKHSDAVFDQQGDLTEIKLVYSRPNPPGADDAVDNITLALIGENIDADELRLAATRSEGSLNKEKDGFLRRSFRALVSGGYLKTARAMIGNTRVDLMQTREKQRETPGYTRDQEAEPLGLNRWAVMWLTELVKERDIYRDGR